MCTWKFTDIFLQHKTWKPVNKLCGETQKGEEKNFPKLGFHRFSMPSTYPLWIGIGYWKSVMNDQRWRCTADFFPFFWVRHLDDCTIADTFQQFQITLAFDVKLTNILVKSSIWIRQNLHNNLAETEQTEEKYKQPKFNKKCFSSFFLYYFFGW